MTDFEELMDSPMGLFRCQLIAQEYNKGYLFGYLSELCGLNLEQLTRLVLYYEPETMSVIQILELFDSIYTSFITKD